MILSFLSQKGGVGKSTLARLVAVEMVRAGWSVKVADLDPAQGTTTKWAIRRDEFQVDPEIPVQKYRDHKRALQEAPRWDLMVIDGPAHGERNGLAMAKASDLVILPTGYSLDDLDPQVALAYDLEAAGVEPHRIALAFCRARGSQAEDTQARDFIRRAGLQVLDAAVRELPSIRQSHTVGRAASETRRGSVDEMAQAVALEIAGRLTNSKELQNERT